MKPFLSEKREKISFPPEGNQCILVLSDKEILVVRQELGRLGYAAIG